MTIASRASSQTKTIEVLRNLAQIHRLVLSLKVTAHAKLHLPAGFLQIQQPFLIGLKAARERIGDVHHLDIDR